MDTISAAIAKNNRDIALFRAYTVYRPTGHPPCPTMPSKAWNVRPRRNCTALGGAIADLGWLRSAKEACIEFRPTQLADAGK
jgi:hypothetical protein